MKHKRWLATASVTAVAALGVALPATAAAGGVPPPPEEALKCNAGNGNGSESLAVDPTGHCFMGDPGNSFNAGNRGGDEVPPGVPNPGGNNVLPLP
jgi:uncharacterized protein YfaQ (DUF2300 family)